MNTLIVSNEEMNDITKISLIKDVSETTLNESKTTLRGNFLCFIR